MPQEGRVLHVVLALYMVAFAMGIAIVALGMLAYNRFAGIAFRQLSAITIGSLLTMLANLLKVYDQVVAVDLAGPLRTFYVVSTAVGLGLIGYAAPRLAFQIVRRKSTVFPRSAALALAAMLSAIGAWKELHPGSDSTFGTLMGVVAVLVVGLVVFGLGLRRMVNEHVRSLVRASLVVLPPLLLLMVVQACLSLFPAAPSFVKEYPLSELLAFLVMDTLLLAYGLRFLFLQEASRAYVLPEQFISRFSISPRECEIISMMVRGLSNRLIAEKLFISAMTVKNHVYHIYQKTSVMNKVQLLNLINSSK
jgi:DNA-binding CsgD family transcriptional regulator